MPSDDHLSFGGGYTERTPSTPKAPRGKLSREDRQGASILIGLGAILLLIGSTMYMGISYADLFGVDPITPTPIECSRFDIACHITNPLRPFVFWGSIIIGLIGFVYGYKFAYNWLEASPEISTGMGFVLGSAAFILTNASLHIFVFFIVFYLLAAPAVSGGSFAVKSKVLGGK